MTTLLELEFENSSTRVYYSGQLLKGQAKIYFPFAIHVKGIGAKTYLALQVERMIVATEIL